MIQINHYIQGRRKASQPSQLHPALNPYNGETIAEFPYASAEEVNSAVESAAEAFVHWRRSESRQRGEYLTRMADEIEKRAEQIATAISQSCGKPISEARFDVQDSVDCYRYYADIANGLDDNNNLSVTVSDKAFSSRLQYQPTGVVALITPWNFPTVTTSWKLAPALAAGCTVVLKPSEYTPLAESFLADICDAADIPPGVVNIIYGAAEAGSHLIKHPSVRKVSFTGSTTTGAFISHACADDIKNVSLELGGKSPVIVFDDADIEQAVSAVTGGILFNNGQMCSATSRLLVQQNIAPQLLRRLRQTFADMRPGDPADDNCVLGPLANQAQYEKVCAYFDIAAEEKLNLLTGGKAFAHPTSQFMVEPTIYTDVPLNSRLWTEEIFGPVLCTHTFTSEDEAIAIANDCDYGLAATIISATDEHGERIADQIEAGHIWINTDQRVLTETSWGGMKKSGLGRELGPWGLSAYREVKHITRCTGGKA